MTFKELYQNIFTDIDESLSDTELLTKIKGFINRGYKELSKREYLSKTSFKTSINGKISFPSDCFKVSNVTYNGISINFEIQGRYIYIDDDITVKIDYFYYPEQLEDDEDETETNPVNDEFIISYAKCLYYKSEGLTLEADVCKKEYESYKITKSPTNIIKITDVYGGDSYF